MKRKNPYILVAIIWLLLTAIFATASVVLFVDGRLAVGSVFVCFAIGFAFTLGGLVEKAKSIAEWNKQCDWLHEMAKAINSITDEEYQKLCEERRKRAEQVEPFAEFDKPSELPFEEVRNREK